MNRLAEHLVDTAVDETPAAIAQLGAEAVAEEAAAIAASPLAPVLARALAHIVGAEASGWQTATASFIEGLTDQRVCCTSR
ncbi:hypothetical protein Q5425_26105 [Amycolatopsis sp. A133]|uniref:hypothetical protein n=1 Tax=Amycolatopsis sp. A133 TaxID=3064472 RepID=UPI0027E9E969|nr:hypothetical protein [Amycolatopsis sp. A133]MDQ7807226.1 hypothetical protein [Amycolatopsis sp. A133]